jgi:F420-non-reducing hydrogenase large subunit
VKRITIDPITRLEGHGKIEIFLDDAGDVADAYFQVPELRGFESFCVGRPAEEMPSITNRICGVCPEAHLMASVKALDDLFLVTPPPAALKVRELLYMAFFVTDHATHFYALGGPDFIVGPDAPPRERNILGVVRKMGLDVGKAVISCRARNHRIIELVGGRSIHPAGGLPGGWSKAVSDETRLEAANTARKNIDFSLFTLDLFDKIVLKNPSYFDMTTSDAYIHKTYYMGTVDKLNRLNFYDGDIRVVSPDGTETHRYRPADYLNHIAERVEPWTYMKFPYLKKPGWKGFIDGVDSGVYSATPLARLNAADSIATPLAQEHFQRFYEVLGGAAATSNGGAAGASNGVAAAASGRRAPVHFRLATHWARLIEMLYASERMLELALDPETSSTDIRRSITGVKGVGIGSVEAPRGTLTHHYETDSRGILTRVNLIVGTTNNHAPMAMSIKLAARKHITAGKIVEEGFLNRIEMAFRLYDPCLSCSTHSLPGRMPMVVNIRNREAEIIRSFRRDG